MGFQSIKFRTGQYKPEYCQLIAFREAMTMHDKTMKVNFAT